MRAVRSPARRRFAIAGAAGVAAILVPVFAGSSYVRYIAVLTVMYAAVATAWNILGGLTSYVSLGHAAFFGVGAYVTGILVTRFDFESTWTIVPGALATSLAALVLGRLVLRATGVGFVIISLSLVYILGLVARGWRGMTGGSSGIVVPNIYDAPRDELHVGFYYAFLLLAGIALLVSWLLTRSRLGLYFVALRDDEPHAEGIGIATKNVALVALVSSAALTGLCGGLYTLWSRLLDPGFIFSIGWSADVALIAILGGTRSLWGPCLGALIFVPVNQHLLREFGTSEIHLVFSGVLLVAVVLALPNGVIPAARQLHARRIRMPKASAPTTATGVVRV